MPCSIFGETNNVFANCYKEIPAGKSYYKHQDTNQSYCSLDCLIDHTITLETSEGEESTEE